MSDRAFLSSIPLFVVLLAACGSQTRTAPPLTPPPVTRVMVVGMSNDPIQISAFENIYSNTLRSESQTVCLIGTGLPDLREGITLDSLQSAASKANAHAIVINRIVKAGDRAAGETTLAAYLDQARSEAGLWRELDKGVIESVLFDVASGAQLWRGESGNVNPKGRLKELSKASVRLANRLAGSDKLPEAPAADDGERISSSE